MRGVLQWVETDAADPPSDKARILARGQGLIRATPAREQVLARLSLAKPEIVVQRLPCHLRSGAAPERPAWNKGKLTGPKPPLRPGHVWLIRAKLQLERPTRDLALFNLAIDSKLRGCDLTALRIDDVAPNGYAVDRANVRQRKQVDPCGSS